MRRVRGVAVAAIIASEALVAGRAAGQVSGSVSVVSDYRYRGVSLTNDKRAVQGSIAYDHETGWYGGVFASNAELYDRSRVLHSVFYAGYARRIRTDLSWDCGASAATFSGRSDYDYYEVFCGLASDKINAKVYYSPNYYSLDAQTIYVELNGALPLRDRLRLTGHVGALNVIRRTESYGYSADPHRYDIRLGASLDLDWARAQLAWVASNRGSGLYPVSSLQKRHAVVASLSRQF